MGWVSRECGIYMDLYVRNVLVIDFICQQQNTTTTRHASPTGLGTAFRRGKRSGFVYKEVTMGLSYYTEAMNTVPNKKSSSD